MAEAPTPTAPAPEETRDTNDIGIFVSTAPIGYVEPPLVRVRAIEAALRAVGAKEISQSFLRDLLTIKLIAPEASKRVVIYSGGMAAELIASIRQALVDQYHQEAQDLRTRD